LAELAGDVELVSLLADARTAIEHPGREHAGARLFRAVSRHPDRQLAGDVERALARITAELGFATVAIFRARATVTHALRALELLELQLRR
jgi:hypothetical protein